MWSFTLLFYIDKRIGDGLEVLHSEKVKYCVID